MINGLDFLLIYAAFSNNHYCGYTGFFPDISLIWLMDWFTCWYTRHSLMISLNGLVYNFKFGIFAWYPFFAGKNSLVKIRIISGFFPKSGYFLVFSPKSGYFQVFSPKSGYFLVFSPNSGYFPIFPPKIRIFSDFSLYVVLITRWWTCFQQIKQFEM